MDQQKQQHESDRGEREAEHFRDKRSRTDALIEQGIDKARADEMVEAEFGRTGSVNEDEFISMRSQRHRELYGQ